MFDLVLLHDIFLVDRFHGEKLFRVFLFNQQHSPEGSLPQNDLRHKIIDRYFFLQVVPRIQGFRGLSDHLFLFLLAVDILLEGNVVVKYVLSFDLFDPFFFLLLFCGCVVNEVELFAVENGEFGATGLPTGFEDAKDDLVSPF